jgi:small-conductance mechanosensitive channel
MPETTEKTIEQLQAEIAAAQMELERRELAPLAAVIAAFNDNKVKAARTAAETNLLSLTGERRQQVQNLITVLSLSTQFLAEQHAAIDARVNPPAAPEVPPAP